MESPPGFVTPRVLMCALLDPKKGFMTGQLPVRAASALLTNRTNKLNILNPQFP